MPTVTDTTNEIQSKFFAGLEASQNAVVTLVGTWAETVETVMSRLPELTTSGPARPTEAFQNALGFTEKLVASQRDFANRVFEAAMPATRAPASTARSAQAQAAQSAQGTSSGRSGPSPKA